MVTVQDIGLQLTKPVKELAQWNFPFSETLEQYCSLFDTTCNKRFGEAGLVLQNSTAVYVQRIDTLWAKIEDCRNALSSHDPEETTKSPSKRRDRKADMFFHKFKTVNFAAEVDKNIDIKKNHTAHVKSKSRFPQLEKQSAQHVSVNIYDVNGEIIGKKYDFWCNQNMVDGILVDEFTPRDFCCGDDDKEKSSNYSHELCDTSALDTTVHDNSNENVNTDAESDRDDLPEEEFSELATSFEMSQQSLSLCRDPETDNTMNVSSYSNRDVTLTNTPNQSCRNTPVDTNLSIITSIENTSLSNNNNSEDQCLNNNIKGSIDVGSLLDSPPESVNSKGRRTSSTDDPASLNYTNEDLAKSLTNSIINIPSNDNRIKTRQRSTAKSPSKLLKRKVFASCKRQPNARRKNLHSLEDSYHLRPDRLKMLKATQRSCLKYIREYDPLQYDMVTNEESDLLGFRLHVDTQPDVRIDKDVTTNVNDVTSSDDEVSTRFSELRSPSPMGTSPPHESFCNAWFRSDSPHFSSEIVDKWHEMIQPKLRDAEQRSTFCIHDYASRIMETLKTSGQRKINFDAVIQKERPCEVARYFLASLDLASKRNLDIKTNEGPEHNIEIAVHEEDVRQCPTDSQADSHD